MGESSERRKAHIEALREERRGYEARNLKDRVKQVDDQIANLARLAGQKPKATRG